MATNSQQIFSIRFRYQNNLTNQESSMLREIRFTIFEKPIPQKRHRHTKTGRTYDPCKKDKLYYGILIKRAIEPHTSLKEHLLCGPISIDMKFYFGLPKTPSVRKKKGLYCDCICDIDNLQKFIMDVMTGILFADDRYVYSVTAKKFYTTEKPRTEVTIKEVIQEQILENNNVRNKKTQVPGQKNIWPATLPQTKPRRP